MTLIAIRERPNGPAGSNAVLSFDGLGEFPISVRDPFEGTGEEERLEWYFERHLRFPFADTVKAREAAASVERYGEALFEQVFADRPAFARYSRALQAGVGSFQIEIAGSPEFHGLHWEALKDPALPRALSLEAPLVRKNLVPQAVEAVMHPSPTINLLIVTARPHGSRDVGYRTISRPLVERLRQAKVPVRIEILRPGTYPALVEHLEEVRDRHGAGFYHVIHFDTHGGLLTHEQLQKGMESEQLLYQTRYGRDDLGAYEGLKAFLLLEAEKEGQADPIEAGELADLLKTHQVPIVILNACQSGKQVGDRETSLGSRLMEAGLQVVLAMAYSVTVSAAERLMEHLYAQLFEGKDLAAAIRRARLELYNQKARRAYFDRMIDLEDWVLPVVYQNQPVRPAVREMTAAERSAYYEWQAAGAAEPETTYGFVGRDLDILAVERRLLRHNLLLVRGMGGAGKTTLLTYLASWWQGTGFVRQVFAFAYDDRAWSRQQILVEIARKLLGEARFHAEFLPLSSLDAQQAFLARLLRAERHLLILDNLESITGAHLAILNTLPPAEQEALRRFLGDLEGGRTLVLLGSRGGESWLAPGTFEDNVHDLPGLDPQAASTLAQRILERHGAARYREDPDLARLLALLAGYPLALQVVLKNLARQTPAQVLAGLQAGDVSLDTGDSQEKTESILRCIDYSHGNLSPEAQGLLVCLAPFVGVVNTTVLPKYSEFLRAQPALAHLPFDCWREVLEEAADWGLVSSHELPGYLHLQPTLPYFLRSRLQTAEQAEARQAVETGFGQLYERLAAELYELLNSREPEERMIGKVLAGLEYENLTVALDLALGAKASILRPYGALSAYLDHTHDEARGLELGERVLAQLGDEEERDLPAQFGFELAGTIDNIAKRQLFLKRYGEAQESYRKALNVLGRIQDVSSEFRAKLTASTYHQLGVLAQEQHQWAEAESHYKQVLKIKVNDRYSQASTYHQLGILAQEQRQWAAAESYYKQALQIEIDSNDRHSQGMTYHQLGIAAQGQGQWAEAESYYKLALRIHVDFNDRHLQGSTYHQLGTLAQWQRQWPEAESYYKQALQIRIDFNNRHSQAMTYHQLGAVMAEQQQWAQACEYLLQALTIFSEYQDSHSRGVVLRTLAKIWKTNGDTELPKTVAGVLGITSQEAEDLLRG